MNKVSLWAICLFAITAALFVHSFKSSETDDSVCGFVVDDDYHRLNNELSLIEYRRIEDITKDGEPPSMTDDLIRKLKKISSESDEHGYNDLKAKADSMIVYYKLMKTW